MSSFAETLAFFNQKAKKEEIKEKTKNDKPPKPKIQNSNPNSFKEILDIFNIKKEIKPNIKNNINDENIPKAKSTPQETKKETKNIPPETKKEPKNIPTETKKETKNFPPEIKKDEIKPKIKNIVNDLNISEIKKSPIEIKNEVDKPKLIEGSELISNENPELKIYKYPNINFDKNTKDNCKVLLFIGDNPDQFINSFINIYSGVNYEDNFRYKIFSDNNSYSIHNIKKGTSKYNLIIISIASSIENGEFMKYIYDIFNIKTMPKKINSIFITLEEKSQLLNKCMITFLSFINLSNKEAMENKINILFSKEDSKNIFNEENNNFVFDNDLNKALTSLYKPKFFYINNNIIYDKKPENKDQWKKLNEQITDIKEKIIGKSKSLTMDKERESFFATFLNNNDKKFKQIIKIFEKLKNFQSKSKMKLTNQN